VIERKQFGARHEEHAPARDPHRCVLAAVRLLENRSDRRRVAIKLCQPRLQRFRVVIALCELIRRQNGEAENKTIAFGRLPFTLQWSSSNKSR
jgi:hypothetical protein